MLDPLCMMYKFDGIALTMWPLRYLVIGIELHYKQKLIVFFAEGEQTE